MKAKLEEHRKQAEVLSELADQLEDASAAMPPEDGEIEKQDPCAGLPGEPPDDRGRGCPQAECTSKAQRCTPGTDQACWHQLWMASVVMPQERLLQHKKNYGCQAKANHGSQSATGCGSRSSCGCLCQARNHAHHVLASNYHENDSCYHCNDHWHYPHILDGNNGGPLGI